MKFGTDIRWLRYDDLGFAIQNGSQTFTGLFSQNALADMLLGLPARGFAHTAGPGSQFTFFTRNGEYSFYFQDDIKLTPNLTLNAGVRYEYVQWPLEVDDNFGFWNFERGTLDFAGVDIPRRTADPDRNNWGPRLGLAYTPGFSKKTVIRAGAGITYGNYRQWEVSLLHFQPPFVFGNFLFNDPTAPFTTSDLYPDVPDRREDIDLGQTALAGAAAFQDTNKVLPITYQWNFAIQHEILPNFLLEVGYVGNRSEKQPNRWDANAAVLDEDPFNPTPIQSRRPYQNASFVTANTWRAWSNYNALTVRAERRFTNSFALLGTYTWSKAMAIRGHDNWTVMDINDIRRNYGPANDFAQRAVISYVYELPFGPGKALLGDAKGALAHLVGGWQVNGITIFRSGAALRLTSPVSNNLGNRAGNKPNRIADGNLPTGQRTVERWFDTSAFVDPVVGRYGNAGEGIIRGPGLVNWDVSLFKNAKITEKKTLQFRFEFFNAFNNVNLNNPANSTGSARFGAVSGAGLAREIQVGLKFLF